MKKHFYYYYTNRHALNSDYIPVMANCQIETKSYYLSFKGYISTFSFNYVHEGNSKLRRRILLATHLLEIQFPKYHFPSLLCCHFLPSRCYISRLIKSLEDACAICDDDLALSFTQMLKDR